MAERFAVAFDEKNEHSQAGAEALGDALAQGHFKPGQCGFGIVDFMRRANLAATEKLAAAGFALDLDSGGGYAQDGVPGSDSADEPSLLGIYLQREVQGAFGGYRALDADAKAARMAEFRARLGRLAALGIGFEGPSQRRSLGNPACILVRCGLQPAELGDALDALAGLGARMEEMAPAAMAAGIRFWGLDSRMELIEFLDRKYGPVNLGPWSKAALASMAFGRSEGIRKDRPADEKLLAKLLGMGLDMGLASDPGIEGVSPLKCAVEGYRLHVLPIWESAGMPMDWADPETGENLLHLLAKDSGRQAQKEAARLAKAWPSLLGGKIREPGRAGCTPLMAASGALNAGAALAYLENGADASAIDESGRGALSYAARRWGKKADKNMAALVKALAKAGAPLDAKDSQGKTPLQWMVSRAPLDAVRELLDLTPEQVDACKGEAEQKAFGRLVKRGLEGRSLAEKALLSAGPDAPAPSKRVRAAKGL